MNRKTAITGPVFLFLVFSVFSTEIFINTGIPYASGKLTIDHEHDYMDDNLWYRDTIVFSGGSKVTFMDLNAYPLKPPDSYDNWYGFNGGIVFPDTLSAIGYRHSDSLNKYGLGHSPREGEFSFTTGNPDIIWDKALSYPDSLVPCDTFAYVCYGTGSQIYLIKAKHLYDFGGWETIHGLESMSTSRAENFNSLVYIKTLQNTHIKLQISDLTIHSSPNFTSLSKLTFRWAVDSLGNGLFKHDPVNIKQNPFKSQDIKLNTMRNIKRIDVYDLLGRKISTLPPNIDIENFKGVNGVCIVQFVGKGFFNRKIMTLK
jgi:hypothetical protein